MTAAAMRVEFINPFITSTKRVFETMIGISVERGTPYLRDVSETHEGLIGVIGLTGKAIGTAAVCVGSEVAISICERFLGTRPSAVDSDVVDSIGELINMIAGNAKSQLEEYEMQISLPSIIRGKDHMIDFPHMIQPVCIPFTSSIGNFMVQIGFIEAK
jgi:chemotaxis protein CheX